VFRPNLQLVFALGAKCPVRVSAGRSRSREDAKLLGRSLGEFGFDFSRYGVRVPALLISPRIAPGAVFRAKSGTICHTSVLKTIQDRWKLPSLTKRDKAAPSLADVLTLAKARKDDPLHNVVIPVSKKSHPLQANPSEIERLHAEKVASLPPRRLMTRRLVARALLVSGVAAYGFACAPAVTVVVTPAGIATTQKAEVLHLCPGSNAVQATWDIKGHGTLCATDKRPVGAMAPLDPKDCYVFHDGLPSHGSETRAGTGRRAASRRAGPCTPASPQPKSPP